MVGPSRTKCLGLYESPSLTVGLEHICSCLKYYRDDVLLTSVNMFKSVGDLIIKLVSEGKKGGKVRVVTSYDIDSVVAAGIILKYLQQNDVRFEYLTVLDVDSTSVLDDVPTITIDVGVKDLKRSLSLIRSERMDLRKLGTIYEVLTPYYSYTIFKALEDFMIVTNDVRYYVLASMLSRFTPRVRYQQVDELLKNYLRELSDLNIIKVVRGPKLFNYSVYDLNVVLSRSLDLFVPRSSGVKDLKGLSEEDLIKYVMNCISVFTQMKFSSNDLIGDNYIITQEWVFKDVYELLYALVSISDVYGVEYVVTSVLLTNYIPLIRFNYEELLKDLISKVYSVRDGGLVQVRKNVYKARLDSLVPLTPISKILKSYVTPLNSIIVYEVGNENYLPLSEVSLETIDAVVKKPFERVGALLKFKEFK